MPALTSAVKIAVSVTGALLLAPAVGVLSAGEPVAPAADVRLVQAEAAIESALGEVASLEDGPKAEELASIAAAQATAGDAAASLQTFTRAIQTAQNIRSERVKDHALGNIAEAQAKAGDVSGGLQTAQSIKEDSLKIGALISMSAWFNARDVSGALQAARSIKEEGRDKDSALASLTPRKQRLAT